MPSVEEERQHSSTAWRSALACTEPLILLSSLVPSPSRFLRIEGAGHVRDYTNVIMIDDQCGVIEQSKFMQRMKQVLRHAQFYNRHG